MNSVLTILAFCLAIAPASPVLYDLEHGYTLEKTTATVFIVIKPAIGWKWNKDYPYRFDLEKLEKSVLKRKEIVVTPEVVTIIFEIEGIKNPTQVFEAKTSFSLCSKIICRSWHHLKFKIRRKE